MRKRRPDQLPQHGTDVSEGGIQTAGSGVLERSQPPSATAGEEKPAGRGPGQRVHAASLRDAGLWQPVAIHLHDGDSEQGPLQIYSGVKACGRPDLVKFRFVASFCIVKKDGKIHSINKEIKKNLWRGLQKCRPRYYLQDNYRKKENL